MEIKPIERKDFAVLQPLIKEEFSYLKLGRSGLHKKLRDKKLFLFKAEEKGKMQGFIEIEILNNGWAIINAVAVLVKSRGRGIGKKLIEFAIDFLKGKKIERIVLLVSEENKKAKELYRRLGFEFAGIHPKQINGKIVEEMELNIRKRGVDYAV